MCVYVYVIVDEPWQIESFMILNCVIVTEYENEMTVDHVVFNRNRYTIRCEQQNWLFLYISPGLVSIIWPSIYRCNEYERGARYKDENWRSSIIWTLLSLYICTLFERKRSLTIEAWRYEHVYTLKLNVYEHMYTLGNVSFSFSSSFFAFFFY
jgi:hypothetical protein